jgi:serine/threonine-protein kinase
LTGDQEEAIRQLDLAAKLAPDHPLVIRALAIQQSAAGQFEEAVHTLLRGERLDPRNPLLPQRLGSVYTFLHRFEDALAAYWREAALSDPPPAAGLRNQARIHLMRGHRQQARSVIGESLARMAESGSYSPHANMATTRNRVVLRSLAAEERRAAFAAFVEWWPSRNTPLSCDRVAHYCVQRAIHEEDLGSKDRARVLWDSLRVALETTPPPDAWYGYTHRALIHMHVGEKGAALAAAQTAVDLYAHYGCRGYAVEESNSCTMLARVLAHFDEQDQAIDLLEEMLPAPSWLTVHLLEIDPIWDPLRDHPRFQALLEEYQGDVER